MVKKDDEDFKGRAGCGCLIIIIVIIIALGRACTGDNSSSQNKTYSDGEKEALAQITCEKEIKSRAIYPPSVKFHYDYRNKLNIDGKNVTINGSVDSQNAFGAMVQQNFSCKVIMDIEADKYWIDSLNID